MGSFFRLFLIGIAASLLPASSQAEPPGRQLIAVTGPPKVLAGDLIAIGDRRFRLQAIDAPEPGQRCLLNEKLYDCGAIARAALMDLTAGVIVTCIPKGEDDPAPAKCEAEGYDLSEGMVYTGWALVDRSGSQRYLTFEAKAKARNHGLWRGRFVAPWDWRSGQRLPEEQE